MLRRDRVSECETSLPFVPRPLLPARALTLGKRPAVPDHRQMCTGSHPSSRLVRPQRLPNVIESHQPF